MHLGIIDGPGPEEVWPPDCPHGLWVCHRLWPQRIRPERVRLLKCLRCFEILPLCGARAGRVKLILNMPLPGGQKSRAGQPCQAARHATLRALLLRKGSSRIKVDVIQGMK